MARLTRPQFRRKTALRLSKSESALEHGFKERDIEATADVASVTLTRVPDVITVATLSQAQAIDIAVPTADPQAFDRIVTVYNASADTVALSVNGGTATATLAAGKRADYLISDSTANTVPTILFVQA